MAAFFGVTLQVCWRTADGTFSWPEFDMSNVISLCYAVLQRHPPNAGVWEQAFSATDQGLECDDGCTATAALAWLDEGGALNLQTANVGDSSGMWITAQHGGTPQVPLFFC